MNLFFLKSIIIVGIVVLFFEPTYAAFSIPDGMAAFYHAADDNTMHVSVSELLLFQDFYKSKRNPASVELDDVDFSYNQRQRSRMVFEVIDPCITTVFIRGSSNVACDIVFPDGVQDCSVIREENARFTGKVVNGTLSTTILPSSEPSSSCCMQ